MVTKIKIRMGDVEVEYEGSEEFLRDELKELLAGVVELHRQKFEEDGSPDADGQDGNSGPRTGGLYQGTTNTVCAKLSAKSGTDMIIAALSQRTLVQRIDASSRADILKEMQTAKSYYKQTYSKSLSQYLKSLLAADKIREVSKDMFSLSADELKRVRTVLAS